MIKHLLTMIWNQRKSNTWLWAELLLVSVFLWFIVDFFCVTAYTYYQPTGTEIDHTYQLMMRELTSKSAEYIPAETKTTTSGEDLQVVLDRVRNYPGIEAACLSFFSVPYSQGNSYQLVGEDTTRYVAGHQRHATPGFFQVFRVKTKEGKDVQVEAGATNVVISAEMEKEMYGDQPGLGKPFVHSSSVDVARKVAAVTHSFRYLEFDKRENTYFLLMDAAEVAKLDRNMVQYIELCIRVSPEADKDFAKRFRQDMKTQMRVGNLYLMDIVSFDLLRTSYLKRDMNEVRSQLSVLGFLLLNIFLGIIGTFWFRTQYRKGEMGLRIALGETRRGLMSILIGEGLVLLALAMIPAGIICINVGLMDIVGTYLMPFGILRFLVGISITVLLLAIMIMIGIWYPARLATKIQPAEALHYE